MKPVYVGGSTHDVRRVQAVQRACVERGWLVTFDWTRAEGNMPDGTWDEWPDLGREIAIREVNACIAADLAIILFPPEPRTGLGCWIETGCTLASGGEVWIVAPRRDSVFWQHPRMRCFESFEALIETLEADAQEKAVA